MNVLFVTLVVCALMAVYLIPSFIAAWRDHHQRVAITMLNFFGGWTALGWVAALAWACTQTQAQRLAAERAASES